MYTMRINREFTTKVGMDKYTKAVLMDAIETLGYSQAGFVTIAVEEKLLREGYARRYDESSKRWIWLAPEVPQANTNPPGAGTPDDKEV